MVSKLLYLNQLVDLGSSLEPTNYHFTSILWLILWCVIAGFFPEEWDNFLVKYLYPSFTPTVLLFLAGAVAFGVVKYKQNENLTERK